LTPLFSDEYGFVSEGSQAHILQVALVHLSGRGLSRIFSVVVDQPGVTSSILHSVVSSYSVER
jgi:hypothetical protein